LVPSFNRLEWPWFGNRPKFPAQRNLRMVYMRSCRLAWKMQYTKKEKQHGKEQGESRSQHRTRLRPNSGNSSGRNRRRRRNQQQLLNQRLFKLNPNPVNNRWLAPLQPHSSGEEGSCSRNQHPFPSLHRWIPVDGRSCGLICRRVPSALSMLNYALTI
jgi:hypothetical protein